MTLENQQIQDQILERVLEDVPFDGWTWSLAYNASEELGFEKEMADAVFPNKLQDLLVHFSDWTDRKTLEKLNEIDSDTLRIRDKIEVAVKAQLEVLEPHRECVKLSSAYWLYPFRKLQAAKIVWRSADHIWNWAGDTATDYNHYTKRALLSGVMVSTTVFWLNDESDGYKDSYAFLSRRIENVLRFGKLASKIKPKKCNEHKKEATA